eukprot:Gb_29483 [translate_table: standard]
MKKPSISAAILLSYVSATNMKMCNRMLCINITAFVLCLMVFMPCIKVQGSLCTDPSSIGGGCGLEEEGEDGALTVRRFLESRVQYISYAVLAADGVPCSITGQSYYYCNSSDTQVNPYTRACTAIARCARDTS